MTEGFFWSEPLLRVYAYQAHDEFLSFGREAVPLRAASIVVSICYLPQQLRYSKKFLMKRGRMKV